MDILGARHSIKLDANAHVVGVLASRNPAGSLLLVNGFEVAAYTKPNWLHRWAMRLVFGWKWRDAAAVVAADREQG